MPEAVTHILVPLILVSLIRDFYIRKNGRKNFPLHYVLIAGIAGILPDIDIIAYWFLNGVGFTFEQVHRTFMHSIFVPLIFVVFAAATIHEKIPKLGKHKLKLPIIFLMIALGCLIHLILDAIFVSYILPLYPFSNMKIGIDLFSCLPQPMQILAPGVLDGILLVVYFIYLEVRHKISDFI